MKGINGGPDLILDQGTIEEPDHYITKSIFLGQTLNIIDEQITEHEAQVHIQ